MNMHGIFTPMALEARPRTTLRDRAWTWMQKRRMFLLVVVVPTLLVAGYLYLIAADQYVSEAHFLVRSPGNTETAPSGMSAALSLVTGTSTNSQSEAMSVADYLTSHDAVAALRRDDRLVERFHRPEADFFSRLRSANPTPEKMLKYYLEHVEVRFDAENGIAVLQVHSFTPQDSFELVSRLLKLGEGRVNVLNTRSYEDAIALSRRQLADAESRLADVQARLTAYRQKRGDIDPQASGTAQIGLVTTLTGELSTARAQLASMGRMISPSSPQYQAVAARVRALEAQVGTQSGRLTGGERTIASDIGGYEGLQLQQQFLAKRYEAAAASLEKARDNAIRQQLYLVRVVEPNFPVKALFPHRGRIMATVVISLLLAYSIGWLIVAGVREHTA